ncbi:hypothetical protein PUNSTDRAFT_97267 [Punctularia strigosozonata HHB-11173 SS5]|uniref:uncharacterized protein n=1 Tax=Punctularia strigosozonata (strain HHB-11173) TaxID=741275 RepID=UPI0004417B74|nr:uncharacterized protein PUNSTDRAFT_97267 [Punctularia strigosozonata HHB-11173 SS5]EIN12508.1 hypothetical protein PUNSTDRAFT_97267 [Punctularia strigosozonata HHB-11173 SS5]
MAASSSTARKLASDTFEDYNNGAQTAALKAIKSSMAALPQDVGFHRSVDAGYADAIDVCSGRVLGLINKMLALATSADPSGARKGKARAESGEDLVDRFQAVAVDAMDQLLERADMNLDEFLGKNKAPAIAVNPSVSRTQQRQPPQQSESSAPKPKPSLGRLDPALQHASHLRKPQLSFTRTVDNASQDPWKPTLKHKYNAQVPLGYRFQDEEGGDATSAGIHPYHYEITHVSYPAHLFSPGQPTPPKSFAETPFTWVATPAAFALMLEKLRLADAIAVDLEHHSYRTFAGFVCLMQISTRTEDWIVDTLVLRDELEELNEVFTDPRIVKVFHGAESDIQWLQQDFNVFVVGLFDTFHASKVLHFPRHGLASLLEMYCDFIADKRYQLADWRIRPLPQEMLDYARSDTHYLLYIYDHLRHALLERGTSPAFAAYTPVDITLETPISHLTPSDGATWLLREVLARSAQTTLRTFERELYDADNGTGPAGWDTLARKWNKSAGAMPPVQRAVYRAVHAWRDRVAREEDESARYVLPNHYLFQIAESPPADMPGLLAAFRPVPPVVRRRAKELLDIVRAAVKSELDSEGGQTKAVEAGEAEMIPDEPPRTTGKAYDVVEGSASDASSPSTGLWSFAPASSNAPLATTASTLLGPSSSTALPSATSTVAQEADTVSVRSKASCSTTRSSLFGSPKRLFSSSSSGEGQTSRIRHVLARIRGSLTVGASVPKTPPPPPPAAEEDAKPVPEQIEVPFVPLAQRQPVVREVVDDAIVVVGQRQQKKRKRNKEKKDGKAEVAPGKADAGGVPDDGVVEEFDYATASNILDEDGGAPEPVGRPKKKPKAKGAAGYQYGDFPAPPRAHRDVKSGNQSHTYR